MIAQMVLYSFCFIRDSVGTLQPPILKMLSEENTLVYLNKQKASDFLCFNHKAFIINAQYIDQHIIVIAIPLQI